MDSDPFPTGHGGDHREQRDPAHEKFTGQDGRQASLGRTACCGHFLCVPSMYSKPSVELSFQPLHPKSLSESGEEARGSTCAEPVRLA